MIRLAIIADDLEVTMVRRQPLVDDFRDLDHAGAEMEAARRFLAAVSRMAVYPDESLALEGHWSQPFTRTTGRNLATRRERPSRSPA